MQNPRQDKPRGDMLRHTVSKLTKIKDKDKNRKKKLQRKQYSQTYSMRPPSPIPKTKIPKKL